MVCLSEMNNYQNYFSGGIKMSKPKVMLTVDVEALPMRAESDHVNTLIYGRRDGKEYGIGRMMDIADKHNIKMTFFVDFAECELYGDDILEVGRYIMSRGHDMQVHCHYDLLAPKVGKPAFVNVRDDYYSWCKNDDISKLIVDYLTDKYIECTGKMPLAFRGGEYRFGVAMLKALKEKGYIADLSYNCIRPEDLPENKQFEYENGLLEFPVGVLHNKKPLNFNYRPLVPKNRADFEDILDAYKTMFDDYFDYYGKDAIASMIMKSWSFMDIDEFDKNNDLMVEFFDYFIDKMKEYVEFVSVIDAIKSTDRKMLKKVNFNAIYAEHIGFYKDVLKEISSFIHEKIGDRNLVIWGKGTIENSVFREYNFYDEFKLKCFISNDADINSMWRNKPVYKFESIKLSPQNDYVLILALSKFSEIRESLRNNGFDEFKDYYDIQNPVSLHINSLTTKRYVCPIWGGDSFEIYKSRKKRRCATCGSVERTRTAVNIIDGDIKIDFANKKLLHVSPDNAEKIMFSKMNAIITTIDIRSELNTDIVADICNMPEVVSESYDVIFASDVLECVYDVDLALKEFKRVLNDSGIVILYVSDSGTLKNIAPNRSDNAIYGKEYFNKYKVGFYRYFGEVDFTRMLRKYFSKVRCFEKCDEITNFSCKWYICEK